MQDAPQSAHSHPDIPSALPDITTPQQQAIARRRARVALAGIVALALALWLALAWGAWNHLPLPTQHGVSGFPYATLLIPFGVTARHMSPPPSGTVGSNQVSSTALACTSKGEQSLGASIVVTLGEWVCGSVVAYGGNVTVLGRVSGNVQAIHGSVTVLGEVDGNVTALGGDVRTLGHGAVLGQAQAFGGTVSLATDALSNDPAHRQRVGSSQPPFIAWLFMQALAPGSGSLSLSLLFWFCVSLATAVVAGRPLRHTRDVVRRRPAGSLFIGVILGIAAVIASVALTVSFLGIPVALALGVVVILAWALGTLAVGALLGRWLLRPLLRSLTRRHEPPLVLSTLLGTLLLTLLKAIPFVGLGVGIFVGALGLGATALSLLTARRASRRPSSTTDTVGASS